MTTVGDVMDRVRYEWLEPPSETWAKTWLTSSVDSSTTSWPVDLDAIDVEEQNLLTAGGLLEVGSEQVLITDISGSTLTVRRGQRGTTAASHDDDAEVLIGPPYTRKTLFEAVADNIVNLHPPLFCRANDTVTVGDDGITLIPQDCITPERLRHLDEPYLPLSFSDLFEWQTGRAIKVHGLPEGEKGWLTYRARFTRPNTESQSLAGLGVEDQWVQIVSVGSAARLIASRSLSPVQQEFLSGQLASESYPVETPSRIRNSLLSYYQFLSAEARNDLLSQHPPTVQVV